MLNTKGMTKAKYKDCSINKIKKEYAKIIEKNKFKNIEQQMQHDIDNALYSDYGLALNITTGNIKMISAYDAQSASELQELIKEKTGEKYIVEDKTYYYSADDLIDYVAKKSGDVSMGETLKKFFNSLDYEKHMRINIEEYKSMIKERFKDKSEEEINELANKFRQLYKTEILLILANKKNKDLLNELIEKLVGDYDPEKLYNDFYIAAYSTKLQG